MQTAFVCSSALCLCHLFSVLTRHCAYVADTTLCLCTVYGKWHGLEGHGCLLVADARVRRLHSADT